MNARIGYHAIGWRYDLAETVRRVKQLGCDGIEFYDVAEFLEDRSLAARIEKALQETGIQVSGAFYGGSFVEESRRKDEFRFFRKNVRAIKRLGGSYIIAGGGRIRPGHEKKDRPMLYKTIRQLSKVAADEGVTLLFHPHAGTLVFTPAEIEDFAEHIDAREALFTFDTAHLQLGGGNPVALFRQYISHIAYVHLKDLRAGAFVELGEGQVNLPGVCQVLGEHQYDGWIVVELDESEDADASAQISMSYLREKLLLGC